MMKYAFLMLFVSVSALAQGLSIRDYNWVMTDVASRGYSKESLFNRMDRKFVKPGSSICSNRAHMWANDFARLDLDTAKIFLFYTKKRTDLSSKTWWYHVAPAINENGNFWVMDAGFGGWIKGPLQKNQWLAKFTQSTNCKEINAEDTDLIEYIFNAAAFPHNTRHGYYDCYYKITPHTYWTPVTVAQNLLGVDASGRPVRVDRPTINRNELMQACLEATSSSFGYVFRSSKKKCEEYVNGY